MNARFGVAVPEIPPVPEVARDLVGLFWTLASFRPFADGHPQPLTPTDLYHWQALGGEPLSRSDQALLYAMDAAWRAALAEETRYSAERQRAQLEPSRKDPT